MKKLGLLIVYIFKIINYNFSAMLALICFAITVIFTSYAKLTTTTEYMDVTKGGTEYIVSISDARLSGVFYLIVSIIWIFICYIGIKGLIENYKNCEIEFKEQITISDIISSVFFIIFSAIILILPVANSLHILGYNIPFF